MSLFYSNFLDFLSSKYGTALSLVGIFVDPDRVVLLCLVPTFLSWRLIPGSMGPSSLANFLLGCQEAGLPPLPNHQNGELLVLAVRSGKYLGPFPGA